MPTTFTLSASVSRVRGRQLDQSRRRRRGPNPLSATKPKGTENERVMTVSKTRAKPLDNEVVPIQFFLPIWKYRGLSKFGDGRDSFLFSQSAPAWGVAAGRRGDGAGGAECRPCQHSTPPRARGVAAVGLAAVGLAAALLGLPYAAALARARGPGAWGAATTREGQGLSQGREGRVLCVPISTAPESRRAVFLIWVTFSGRDVAAPCFGATTPPRRARSGR